LVPQLFGFPRSNSDLTPTPSLRGKGIGSRPSPLRGGAGGGVEETMVARRRRRLTNAEPAVEPVLVSAVRSLSLPLRSPTQLDPLLERIGEARYVLLGEASHGTHEYYTWRSEISRRLVEEKGFSFIAVEGDWPDCYRVNRYLKGHPDSGDSAHDVLHA